MPKEKQERNTLSYIFISDIGEYIQPYSAKLLEDTPKRKTRSDTSISLLETLKLCEVIEKKCKELEQKSLYERSVERTQNALGKKIEELDSFYKQISDNKKELEISKKEELQKINAPEISDRSNIQIISNTLAVILCAKANISALYSTFDFDTKIVEEDRAYKQYYTFAKQAKNYCQDYYSLVLSDPSFDFEPDMKEYFISAYQKDLLECEARLKKIKELMQLSGEPIINAKNDGDDWFVRRSQQLAQALSNSSEATPLQHKKSMFRDISHSVFRDHKQEKTVIKRKTPDNDFPVLPRFTLRTRKQQKTDIETKVADTKENNLKLF